MIRVEYITFRDSSTGTVTLRAPCELARSISLTNLAKSTSLSESAQPCSNLHSKLAMRFIFSPLIGNSHSAMLFEKAVVLFSKSRIESNTVFCLRAIHHIPAGLTEGGTRRRSFPKDSGSSEPERCRSERAELVAHSSRRTSFDSISRSMGNRVEGCTS